MSWVFDKPRFSRLVLVQAEVSRAVDLSLPTRDDLRIVTFSSTDDWRMVLGRIEDSLKQEEGLRALVFCSLQIATYIRRNLPLLNRNLFFQPEDLTFSRIAGLCPDGVMLNQSFIMLPFGALKQRKAQIHSLFGDRVFLRPDGSQKAFAGYAFDMADFDREVSAIEQIYKIHGDQICVIDRAQAISDHEYRFWVAEGKILTFAGYAHDKIACEVCPAGVWTLAESVAHHIEPWLDPVVADFVVDDTGQPRLIEMNAVSTSGFYPGMDFCDLIEGLDPLVV